MRNGSTAWHRGSCPCEIVADDGRTLLVQTDWDYPGVASSFGWSTRDVQPISDGRPDCDHDRTDGTVNCPDCGLDAGAFIDSAREYLENHDGETAEDPGYFD